MATDNSSLNVSMDEDTISLVDLVAVVLSHRKLIIFATLAAVALGILAYFAYPFYSLAKAERERIVEVNMSLMPGSSFEGGLGEVESTNFLMQSLTDPANILSALRVAGYSKIEKTSIEAGADQEKAVYAIRRRFIDNKGIDGLPLKETVRVYSVKLDKGVLSIIFKNGDPDKAKAFFDSMLLLTEAGFRDFLKPYVESTIESYERLLAVQNPNEAIEASIAQGYRSYSTAKALAAGTTTPLTLLRKPYVLVPELSLAAIQKDVLKKVIILVFGVFFMSVFAAFVLQYIETVKKDPESMNKIRDALRKH